MVLCSTNALYEFTWCLYVCIKGEFHNSADDLVDMYHVLLSCLDFVYVNAFMDKRTDLINPEFKGKKSLAMFTKLLWFKNSHLPQSQVQFQFFRNIMKLIKKQI